MQVDEKPVEDYTDVGGLDKQIKELVEAIVLPVTHKDKFKALGIRPPKGRCCHMSALPPSVSRYQADLHLDLHTVHPLTVHDAVSVKQFIFRQSLWLDPVV